MKQKQRERMRPKKGGLEISYDILHNAFFRHQTRPDDLTGFGDLYYEGKEAMMKFRRFKPGFVSDALKKALGMTPRYRVVSPGGVKVRNKREDEETGEEEWYDVQELKYGQYVVWDSHCGPKRIRISAPCTGFVWMTSKDGKEELLKRCVCLRYCFCAFCGDLKCWCFIASDQVQIPRCNAIECLCPPIKHLDSV